MTPRTACFLALLATATAARETHAQASDPRARAQQLFDSALVDAEAGRFAAACPKFLASQAADPKTSTLLNLASCYEKNGQSASAWGAFREAETSARRISRADWETLARSRAEELEPRLVRLVIRVDASPSIAGLTVMRDDMRLPSGEWNVPIPVDPGTHELKAEAPGYVSFRTKVEVLRGTVIAEVPALAPVPEATAPPAFWTTTRTVGVVVAGLGVAAMATGGVLGFVSKANYDDARDQCVDVDRCPRSAVLQSNRAYDLAAAATVSLIAGAVVAVAGGAIVYFAPAPRIVASNTSSLALTGGVIGTRIVW